MKKVRIINPDFDPLIGIDSVDDEDIEKRTQKVRELLLPGEYESDLYADSKDETVIMIPTTLYNEIMFISDDQWVDKDEKEMTTCAYYLKRYDLEIIPMTSDQTKEIDNLINSLNYDPEI